MLVVDYIYNGNRNKMNVEFPFNIIKELSEESIAENFDYIKDYIYEKVMDYLGLDVKVVLNW